jgi:hypothetical protein
MYVGPALGMFFDEISTGLDSASTYQVANSIVQCSHLLGMVAVVSLLQPEQQVGTKGRHRHFGCFPRLHTIPPLSISMEVLVSASGVCHD